MGLEILGCAAYGQLSAYAEKDKTLCSLSTKVDTRRLRLIAEDFQSHGSSGAVMRNILE